MTDKKDQLKRFKKVIKESKVIFDTIIEAAEDVTQYDLNNGSSSTGTVHNLTPEVTKKLNKARNILKEWN